MSRTANPCWSFVMTFELLAFFAASIAPSSPTTRAPCPSGGIQQLRIYQIFDGNKAAFHDRFRDHAQRIMKRYGFHIIAMWETKQGERTEFAYLLQWTDEETMKQRWAE